MDDFEGFTAEMPEKSAWGDIYSDFDVGAAFDKYGLLSREEAFLVLKKNINQDNMLDDFLFLPEIVFDYYFPILIKMAYEIEQVAQTFYKNFVYSFFILVESRLAKNTEVLARWWPQLEGALMRLSKSQSQYGMYIDDGEESYSQQCKALKALVRHEINKASR